MQMLDRLGSIFFPTRSLNYLVALAVMLPAVANFGLGRQAQAKLIIKEQVKFYQVSGRTGAQVHRKFGRRGPRWMRRKHGIAGIQRLVDLRNLKYLENGNKCKILSADIVLSLVYYFPKWTNKKSASRDTQRLWANFEKELVRHEKTHGSYFKETTRRFDKKSLKTLTTSSKGCRGSAQLAKNGLLKAYEKDEARHIAYDKREQRPSTRIRKMEKAFLKAR